MKPSEDIKPHKPKLSFEEFRLYYESAEKVTDRRLSTNRWNYSVCTAVIVASTGLLGWATSNLNFLAIAVIAVIILSLMGIAFCQSWISQIQDFKMLNNAKFEVLNQMAPHVSFGSDKSDERVSFSPFEKEWEALKKTKSAVEIANTNIIALSSSNVEYLIPRAFTWLFVLLIVALMVITLVNWRFIASSSAFVFQITPTPTATPILTPTP